MSTAAQALDEDNLNSHLITEEEASSRSNNKKFNPQVNSHTDDYDDDDDDYDYDEDESVLDEIENEETYF